LARYFVISDYLVYPQYERDGQRYDNQTLPQIKDSRARVQYIQKNNIPYTVLHNRTLVSISKHLEIKVVYFAYGTGNILVKATGLRKAYQLAKAFQTYLSIYCKIMPNPDRFNEYLIEMSHIPEYSWTDKDLARSASSKKILDIESTVLPFKTGLFLFTHYLSDAAKYVPIIYEDLHISDSTAHLEQSYALFDGLMYYSDYKRYRGFQSDDEILKNYLEHKPKYELAFLAAFKAIELLIGNGNLNKSRLKSVFQSQPYSLIQSNSVWERFHEIFAQKPRHYSFEEILENFLDMRNIVAAHGNRKPPKRFLITPDNLFEIQRFATYLIHLAIESHLSKSFSQTS